MYLGIYDTENYIILLSSLYPFLPFIYFFNYFKAKVIPLPAWTGPDNSRRLRLPDLKTIGT
jgi:hypothetical protein